MAGICHIDYHLPSDYISAVDILSNLNGFVLPGFYKSMGDYSIDFCKQSRLDKIAIEDFRNCILIFTELLECFFEGTQIEPDKIGYIFYTNPKCFNLNEVNIPQYLQKKFKMNNASIVTIDQGCTGTIWCMGASNYLLNGDLEKYSLILSASFMLDVESRFMHPTLAGDALGILVLQNSTSDLNIIDSISISDGASSYDKFNNTNLGFSNLGIVKKGVETVEKLLLNNGLIIEDISMMIPQSINHLSYTTIYPNMLRLDPSKVFIQNIPNGGHLGDVDTIRNLKDYLNQFSVPQNANLLLYGQSLIGRDLNYNALLLQYAVV